MASTEFPASPSIGVLQDLQEDPLRRSIGIPNRCCHRIVHGGTSPACEWLSKLGEADVAMTLDWRRSNVVRIHCGAE